MSEKRKSKLRRGLGASLSICALAAMVSAQPVMAQSGGEGDGSHPHEETEKGEQIATVRTGNDPRDFAHKITPYYRYDNRKGDIETSDAVLFFMVPFSFPGTGTPAAITYESPLYRWRDVGDQEDDGLSDWTVRLILKPFVTDFIGDLKASHVFFFEATMPTGDEALTGDQTIGTVGYGPIMTNSPNWFFAPLFFYDSGIDNKSPNEDVDRLRGRIFYQYAWQNGVYVLPEVQLIYDFNQSEFTSNILPEIGWVFKRPPRLSDSFRPNAPPGNAIYLKGGPGVSNSDTGDLDYRIEVGLRFLW